MNLKEAFRYQNFLDGLMSSAVISIQQREHCLNVKKTHHCSKVNAEAEDYVEDVEVGEEFIPNDDVIRFVEYLIEEKEKLSVEINNAKASISFDIDAATATNKYRQMVHNAIKGMLRHKPNTRIEAGCGYKFNVDGNQTSYRYDVEVESVEAYDKKMAKEVMRKTISDADEISTMIDSAKVTTVVNYNPPFDVNDNFNDVIEIFLQNYGEDKKTE